MHGVHEAGQRGQNSPGYQDAGNPDASPNLVQQQIAGNFKEEIAKKENPYQQSELLARDGQFLVHRQRRKTNIDPVEKGNDVEKEEKGKKSDLQFPNRALFDGVPTAGYHGASGFAAGGHIELRLQWHE